MATRLTRFLALVVLALVACHAENAAHGLRPGQILAPLSLHALDGSAISTASFRGRIVVMNFWATWCAPCRAEMDALQKLADDLDPHRFAVIGVSVDNDVNLVQESTLRHDWRFARFVDTFRRSRQVLGVETLPRTLVVDDQGRLIRIFEGAQPWSSPQMLAFIRGLAPSDPAQRLANR